MGQTARPLRPDWIETKEGSNGGWGLFCVSGVFRSLNDVRFALSGPVR